MSFIEALKIVSVDTFIYVVVGEWFPTILSTKRIIRVRLAYKEIKAYMLDMVHEKERAPELLSEKADLLSNFMVANHDPTVDDKLRLSEEEVVGMNASD